ncbi:MAG: amidohydrolase family protein [Cytophagales bacterium]|nr:amidohydrolase family protein [Armatimonadota bacterium]
MQTQDPSLLAVVGATLFDGTGAAPLADAVLVVRAGRVIAAGPRGRVAVPERVRTVDARGKWLVPGLIDLHVHLDEVLTPGAFPLFGVTAVRDVGSRLVTLQKLRARAAKGEPMPRLFWMGRNLDEGKPSWSGAVAVKGAGEVPARIAEMQDGQGVDGVKLYVSARAAVARAVIEEAHRRGLPVTGHLHDLTPGVAAQLGIDNLEHVFTLFSAQLSREAARRTTGTRRAFAGVATADLDSPAARRLIETLARHRVAITPTLSVSEMPYRGERHADAVYGGWADIPRGWRVHWKDAYWSFLQPLGWTPGDYQTAQRANAQFRRMVGRLEAAGVPVVAGTDAPAPWVLPGAGLIHELEMLVQAGLSCRSALLAATGRAAAVLRRTGEVGTLVLGARADFLLVDTDPLKDIRALKRLYAVYQSGQERDRLPVRRAFDRIQPPPPQKPAS